MRDLCKAAVDAALGAGATYADARAVVRRSQAVSTKNGRVENVTDLETEGIGVRVLVGGAWGFSCDRRLDADGARDAALRACAFALAAAGSREKALAPVPASSGTYRTPVEKDPFEVSLSEKVDLCVRAEEALRHPDVKVTRGGGSRAARAQGARHLRRRRDRAGARRDRRRNRRARRERRRLPDALVPVRARRLVRAGRLGVRREPRARSRGTAGRRTGGRAAARRRLPAAA